MSKRKRILVPVGTLAPAGDAILEDVGELVYCVDQELLRQIQAVPMAVMIGDHERFAPARAEAARRLEASLPTVHGIYAWGLEADLPITAEMMDSAPRLEVIGVCGSGADNVDVPAATERGIVVVNAAGAGNHIVAEHAIGLMLALTRGIALADRQMHRTRQFLPDGLKPPAELGLLDGRVLGIVGFGFVGRDLARKCRDAFGMEVLAYDPFFDPVEARRQGVEMVDSVQLLCAKSDFVSVHVPLNAATRGIVGAGEIAAMKPTAYLVNTSRGGTVDAGAMLAALRERRIAGAGLDVFDPEPLPDGHPLFELDNVVLTPHSGGASRELPERLAVATATEMARALRGERPWHVVNPDVLSRPTERVEGKYATQPA